MPPRWITGAIIFFWLATTGWMMYRQFELTHHAGEPPPFFIDLTDEVSANTISWNLRAPGNDQKLGLGRSWVRRLSDRTFELHSDFTFTNVEILKVTFKKVTSMYRVTAEGELKGLSAVVQLDKINSLVGDVGNAFLGKSPEIELGISGKVEDELFTPAVTLKIKPEGKKDWQDIPLPLHELPKIKMAGHGSLVNPMHLVNKMKGLSEGQEWTVPGLNLDQMDIPIWRAEVSQAELRWHDRDVACFRIDYRGPDKKAAAVTWVRRSDGVVLQKEAEYQGKRFILERDK